MPTVGDRVWPDRERRDSVRRCGGGGVTSSLHDGTLAAVRTFNTEGPVVAADHYHIPPLERIDLDEMLGLVRDKKYFVLHAPRQTGKTSALLALRDLLNGGETGDYRCVYANVEAGQAARENVAEGMRAVLSQFALRASLTLGDDSLERIGRDALDSAGPLGALSLALSRWAVADRTPLVLLIDEIDALVGDTRFDEGGEGAPYSLERFASFQRGACSGW